MKRITTIVFCLLAIFSIDAAPDYLTELYEGRPCSMEDGSEGICMKLKSCPMRLLEVVLGERSANSTGRCGFVKFVEIVCCPKGSEKSGLRLADVACMVYENKILGENVEKINPNIFHGERAAAGEFSSMVALGYQQHPEDPTTIVYICRGTLISMKHVLTAAHCVNNIHNYVPTEVRLGSVDLNDNSDYVQRIPVDEVMSHPRYKRSLKYYDIAILKLRRSVSVSKNVQPICLQTKPIPNSLLVDMSVTSWRSNTLQKNSSLSVVDRLSCEEYYEGFAQLPNGLDENMICVSDKNVRSGFDDECQSDSGSPLLLVSREPNVLLGINSFGQGCGTSVPDIYSSVIFYLDWIEDMVWPDRIRT